MEGVVFVDMSDFPKYVDIASKALVTNIVLGDTWTHLLLKGSDGTAELTIPSSRVKLSFVFT